MSALQCPCGFVAIGENRTHVRNVLAVHTRDQHVEVDSVLADMLGGK